jgi:hypothetical protein
MDPQGNGLSVLIADAAAVRTEVGKMLDDFGLLPRRSIFRRIANSDLPLTRAIWKRLKPSPRKWKPLKGSGVICVKRFAITKRRTGPVLLAQRGAKKRSEYLWRRCFRRSRPLVLKGCGYCDLDRQYKDSRTAILWSGSPFFLILGL